MSDLCKCRSQRNQGCSASLGCVFLPFCERIDELEAETDKQEHRIENDWCWHLSRQRELNTDIQILKSDIQVMHDAWGCTPEAAREELQKRSMPQGPDIAPPNLGLGKHSEMGEG